MGILTKITLFILCSLLMIIVNSFLFFIVTTTTINHLKFVWSLIFFSVATFHAWMLKWEIIFILCFALLLFALSPNHEIEFDCSSNIFFSFTLYLGSIPTHFSLCLKCEVCFNFLFRHWTEKQTGNENGRKRNKFFIYFGVVLAISFLDWLIITFNIDSNRVEGWIQSFHESTFWWFRSRFFFFRIFKVGKEWEMCLEVGNQFTK